MKGNARHIVSYSILVMAVAGLLGAASVLAVPGVPTNRLLPVQKDGKWGYINGAGDVVVPTRFDGAADFRDERAMIVVGTGKSAKYGFIDVKGNLIIHPQFDYEDPVQPLLLGPDPRMFNEGMAIVKIGGKWGGD